MLQHCALGPIPQFLLIIVYNQPALVLTLLLGLVGNVTEICADNTRGGSNFGVNSMTYYLIIHYIRALTEHIPMDLEPTGMCAVHSVTEQQMIK